MNNVVVRCAALVILSGAKDVLSAQSLESQVAGARGSVSFTYATKSNVCGTSGGIEISDDSSPGWNLRSNRSGTRIGRHDDGRYERCEVGPAQVLLRKLGSRVSDVSLRVGGRPDAGDTDLGDVRPADAARYLLDITPGLTGRAADYAVMAAMIADAVVPWQRLLELLRNAEATEGARKTAAFWLSRESNPGAVAGLDAILVDARAPLPVRADVLFYAAQRSQEAGLGVLTRVIQSSDSEKLRKDALFHVAQMRSDRARDIVQEVVLRDDAPTNLRKDALFHAAQRTSGETNTWLASVIASDRVPLDVRKDAVFHLAQRRAEASAAIAAVYDGSLPLALKKDLLFHIAQRRDDASLDKLIAIAKTDPSKELRKDALFHLAQSRDARAIKALEDLVVP